MSQVEQCYWLVADGGKPPRFICIEEFGLRWTEHEDKALRLSRREDAEAIAELCEDAWQVVARHAPAAAPASELVETIKPWMRHDSSCQTSLITKEYGDTNAFKARLRDGDESTCTCGLATTIHALKDGGVK